MASPVVAEPPVVENVDAAADDRFEAVKQQLLAGVEPAPPAATPAPVAPVQPETPATPVQAQPAQAAPVAAPSSEPTPPAPAAPTAPQAEVITIDLKALPTAERQAWQDALVKTGGDPVKVASLMWDYNNRLAALHNAPPGSPAAQPATPPASPAPAPAPPVEERIETELASVLPQDQKVLELRAEHSAHIQTIKTICEPLGVKFEEPKAALSAVSVALDKLDREADHITRLLADPDRDTTRDDDLNRKLLAAERQQMKLEHTKDKLEGLQEKFLARRGALRDSIAQKLYGEHEEQQAETEAQRERDTYQQEFTAAWPKYVTAAVGTTGQDGKPLIDPELAADFNEFAKAQTLLAANAGKLDLSKEAAPAQLPQFLATLASKFKADTDRIHRTVAAIYGRKAAANNGGAPVLIPDATPGAQVVPGMNQTPPTGGAQRPADIDDAADQRASQFLAALRGQSA